MRVTSAPLALALATAAVAASAAGPVRKHSVSGFSAGASAAVNHLVAFSGSVDGVGIVGGSPYGCNTLPNSGATCSGFANTGHRENKTIPWKEFVTRCQSYLDDRASRGLVDPLSNLRNKPVFLLSGTDDVWVYQNAMRAVADQFTRLQCSVKTEFTLPAAHSWVVDSETCAHPGKALAQGACCGWKNGSTDCPLPPNAAPPVPTGCCGVCEAGDGDDTTKGAAHWVGWRPPINNCAYDMAGELLRWIHGASGVRPRVSQRDVTASNLLEFNQSAFLPEGWSADRAKLDAVGLLYAPSACRGSQRAVDQCRVHVHYHPCGGSVRDVSTSYFLENGLAAYAEANCMVLVYPQSAQANNPAGGSCFDWYGVTDALFDTHQGVQVGMVLAVIRNLGSILGGAGAQREKIAPPRARCSDAPNTSRV